MFPVFFCTEESNLPESLENVLQLLEAKATIPLLPVVPTCLFPPQPTKGVEMTRMRWPNMLALVGLFASSFLFAGDLYHKDEQHSESVVLPKPEEVRQLTVHPPEFVLRSSDAAAQLVV